MCMCVCVCVCPYLRVYMSVNIIVYTKGPKHKQNNAFLLTI